MTQDSAGRRGPVRATLDLLASMRTAIVLLALIAVASIVGTILPGPAAQRYVYDRLWFHILLGLLGLDLAVCMVWRKRIGMARIWSLLSHSGILLVLVGAMVTLILAERGTIVIREGQTLSAYVPEGGQGARGKPEPLGFGVKLVDFRLVRYPSVDYLYVMRRDAKPISPAARSRLRDRLRVAPGQALDIPGTEYRLTGVAFLPRGGDGVVEVTMPDGTRTSVPATVGTTQQLGRKGLALKILRYEPSFKIDFKTKEVTSDSAEPTNPVVQVALVRDKAEEKPRWLFARVPDFRHSKRGAMKLAKMKMRYLHPSFPVLTAEVEMPSGTQRVRFENGKGVPSPWDPTLILGYERAAGRVKEYESEVEVIENGRVVRRHVIQVNSPLVHKGTRLSQISYDDKNLRYTVLGVSRDSGVWFVYAGFVALTLGLMGKFYLNPFLRGIRKGQAVPGRKAENGAS